MTDSPSTPSSTPIRFWLVLLGTAFALRGLVAWGLFGGLPLASDAAYYAEVATQFVAGTFGAQPYFWPPGWPYVLTAVFAVLGSSPAIARGASVVLGVLTVALVVRLARLTIQDDRSVRIAGWLAALYPPMLLYAGVPNAHPLAGVCLLGLAVALIEGWLRRRPSWGLLAGLALGSAILTRPSAVALIGVGVLAATWIVYRCPERRRLVLLGGSAGLLVTVLCLAPVLAHNARYDAGYTVSTNNERNLFLGNNPHTPYYKTHHLAQRPPDELGPETHAYLDSIYALPDSRAAMLRETRRYVRTHPGATAWRTFSRMRAFWGFDYLGARHVQLQRGLSTPVALVPLGADAGGYVIVILLTLVGLTVRTRLRHGLLLLGLVVGYAAPYFLAFSTGHYHFPVMGLLMPLAALGVDVLRVPADRLRALRNPWLWAALLTFAIIQAEYAYHTLRYAPGATL